MFDSDDLAAFVAFVVLCFLFGALATGAWYAFEAGGLWKILGFAAAMMALAILIRSLRSDDA